MLGHDKGVTERDVCSAPNSADGREPTLHRPRPQVRRPLSSTIKVDVAVIGGGIAGAAAAWWVSQAGARVLLVEQEPQPGLHATGRSAATWEASGGPVIGALASASRALLEHPPVGFTLHALTEPKQVLWTGREGDAGHLDRLAEESRLIRASVTRVSSQQARQLVPGLHPGAVTAGAVHEPEGLSLDVAMILECFLRGTKAAGGMVLTSSEAIFGNRRRDRWTLDLGGQRVETATVIDAAGAWGDVVAERCGVARLGLTPLRRTAAIVAVPDERAEEVHRWPMVIDVADRYYFEPVPGGLLVSPADEHPSTPCDARAEETDVAWAIDQVSQATGVALRHVRRSWAGLRTFTRDRLPAVGPDPTTEGFVWLVGQGGAGIKTAPALGALAAAAALGAPAPSLATATQGVDVAALDPARFGGGRRAAIGAP